MSEVFESDIACILRLAFGRAVPTTPIAISPGTSERMSAFALHDSRLPPRVALLRYSPQQQARAFRTFTVMQALRSVNFPVPAVYYVGWSHYTRFVLLLREYVEGRREEGQTHAFFARVGEHFAQTLAQLHLIRWDTLPDLAVLRFRFILDDLIGQVRSLQTPQLDRILDWLLERARSITEQPYTVIHGDYLLCNILADGTQVAAVLGWDNTALADPRLDVGYASAALGAYGMVLSDQFLDTYQSAAGPVQDCDFWEVFGALRLAVGMTNRLKGVQAHELDEVYTHVWPVWDGLLTFVEQRTGLAL